MILRSPFNSLYFYAQRSINKTPSIYLASQDLYNEESEKARKSLLKYHIRSCTRCTPYATFAGCFTANLGDETVLMRKSDFNQFVRIDTNFLSQVISYLQQLETIKTQIKYSINNSIYLIADTYRYAEYTSINNSKQYHLTEIDRLKSIEYWMIEKRERLYAEYINDISRIEDVSHEEAKVFMEQLIENQLLISELEPSVTGIEPLNQIFSIINRIEHIEPIKIIFNELVSLINAPKNDVAYYQCIENKIKEIIPTLPIPKNTLQVDMFLQVQKATISSDLIDNLKKQIGEMIVLNRVAENQALDDFKKNFYKKYEENRIPLAIALDTEAGIGYAGIGDTGDNVLIENLFIGTPRSSSSRTITHDYITDFTVKKYIEWKEKKSFWIEVTDEDLKPYQNQKRRKFPFSMALFGALQKAENEFDKENFQFEFYSLGGPSGANLLGRFAMGNPDIDKLCRDIVEKEEKTLPDVIFAEISHLPEARMGNILLRPCFRKYEIVYVGKSGLPRENQIDISDLMIYIEAGEIVLWSQKHNKRVMPRLSTAHNFSRGLPIYKFLCDLQMQGYSYPCVWDWGIFSNEKHLPRVVYKNIIWHKARWIIELNDINDLPKEKEKWIDYFVLFKQKYHLPQLVQYSQGDNNLLIDFEQVDMIELFIDYLKKYKKITLVEFLFNPDNCIIQDEEGLPYTNEVIIPFEYSSDEK